MKVYRLQGVMDASRSRSLVSTGPIASANILQGCCIGVQECWITYRGATTRNWSYIACLKYKPYGTIGKYLIEHDCTASA